MQRTRESLGRGVDSGSHRALIPRIKPGQASESGVTRTVLALILRLAVQKQRGQGKPHGEGESSAESNDDGEEEGTDNGFHSVLLYRHITGL